MAKMAEDYAKEEHERGWNDCIKNQIVLNDVGKTNYIISKPLKHKEDES